MPVVYPQSYAGASQDPFAAMVGGAMQGYDDQQARSFRKKANARADRADVRADQELALRQGQDARAAQQQDVDISERGYGVPQEAFQDLPSSMSLPIAGHDTPVPIPHFGADRIHELRSAVGAHLVKVRPSAQEQMQETAFGHQRDLSQFEQGEQDRRNTADIAGRVHVAEIGAGADRYRSDAMSGEYAARERNDSVSLLNYYRQRLADPYADITDEDRHWMTTEMMRLQVLAGGMVGTQANKATGGAPPAPVNPGAPIQAQPSSGAAFRNWMQNAQGLLNQR